MRVLRSPAFVNDLTDNYAYLAVRSASAADKLLAEVEATVDLLAAFPAIGRPRDSVRPGVRSFRLRRFPHVIFYRDLPDAVSLLRLLHGARDIAAELIEDEP